MKKLRFLLWDIDGTVLNFEAAERAAIRKGFRRMQLGECSDAMLADYSAINVSYWEKLERGEMTKPEILVQRFTDFFGRYGIDPSLAAPFNERYQLDLGDTICFNDSSYELIKELSAAFRQYAASNGTVRAQRRKLQLSGLETLFDACFISDEIGAEKPNPAFFEHAFAEIRQKEGSFSPEECMIIGDSLTSDMAGGAACGLVTCWYNPKGKANTSGLRVDYEIRDLNELREIVLKNG